MRVGGCKVEGFRVEGLEMERFGGLGKFRGQISINSGISN